MRFASVRVITDDVARLVTFYEQATGLQARWATEQFAEFVTPSCTLAIGSVQTMALFSPGAAVPEANRTAILEFLVDDVDREHDRLTGLAPEIVQPPTTMPWGNRSLLFRDPDGNLVNFFTPVTEQARARLDH
ncbi:VOC family protein [Kutzneria sp. CA-103260]|uniref:VOC family protein n=1 Tax=Kutzneria sp. CA-103260 TaxID=2802641 RepID=UPI001BA746BB|nr:VOC family protein [Kutzneria sp. CA-103260]QUQ63258.1 glyoxalase/bleomycin resistance/dioxygenase family protein [Kutzneria sp. CA-103260]